MERQYTKSEIIELVNQLENGIDKFIIAGFLYGLNENDRREQFLSIKKSQVDFENSIITLENGRVVVMDEFLKKVTKEAIEQDVYYKIGGANTHTSNEDYNLNVHSPYIIKGRPMVTNNYGELPLSYDGFQTRIKAISSYLVGDRSLTPSTIKKAGAYEILLSMGRRGTYAECEKILKEKGLNIRRNTMCKMLDEIYGPNTRNRFR